MSAPPFSLGTSASVTPVVIKSPPPACSTSGPTAGAIPRAQLTAIERRRRATSLRLRGALVVVDLKPWPTFACLWVALFLAHAVCATYLVSAALAMLLVASPGMDYYADLLRPDLQLVLYTAAVLSLLLVCLHTAQMLTMVRASWRRRRFAFSSVTIECLGGSRRQASEKGGPVSPWRDFTRQMWRVFFSRQGLFGIESPYYEWRYSAAEVAEIVSQSLQAYSSSARLDPERWLIDLYVASVVLNCLSTAFIRRVTDKKYSIAAQRLACVVIDAILDSGTAMMFPFVLLLPYMHAYDPVASSFDTSLLYNDKWFINFINENRQIFPLSAFDLVIKMIPHVSIFVSLKTVRSIVRSRRPRRGTTCPTGFKDGAGNGASVAPTRSPTRSTRRRATVVDLLKMTIFRPRLPEWAVVKREFRHFHLVDRVFIVWSLVIIACQVASSSLRFPADDQCKQPLQPWLVRTRACSLYMFNCSLRDTDSFYDGDLDFLDRQSLAVLVFAHCSALRIPPAIQNFPQLMGIEVYNSSLIEWGADAALSAKAHPVLTYVFVIRTNMSELPRGLLGRDLPATLLGIEFSVTNLTTVPDSVDEVWSDLYTLYIEYSQLTTVPAPLLRMPLSDFSVIGNHIDSFPVVLPSSTNCNMLSLARNPLAEIPASLIDSLRIGVLNLVDTQITAVPPWFRQHSNTAETKVYLHGTPLCQSMFADETKQFHAAYPGISCSYDEERLHGRYPLNVTTPLWQP